jgi:hypothetical protein
MSDESLYHKMLNDHEPFDKITLEVVPRFKTSEMSGDEWRHHVAIKFFFKGAEVASDGFSTMETAVMFLGARMLQHQEGNALDDKTTQALRNTSCDQPSCAKPATVKYRLKRQTARDGAYLDPAELLHLGAFRQFCSVHAKRGDCSREDSDDNYEVIEGEGVPA